LALALAFVVCGVAAPATANSVDPTSESADEGDSVRNFPIPISTNAEKNVTFYTSYGYEMGENWHIPFKLWVSEPSDTARRLLGKSARRTIAGKAGIEQLSDAQKALYKIRIEDFIADSESREEIVIMFDGDTARERYPLIANDGNAKTDRNGNLNGTLVLPLLRAQALLQDQNSSDGWLVFRAVSDDHSGIGLVQLIPSTGTSVISDIDDTIKDTGITKGHGVVLKSTFFENFKSVPCMADMYSSFDDDVVFHYVSGAPWQLYGSLVDFMFEGPDGFPPGSMHMKNVRTNLSEGESFKDIWKLVNQGSKQVTFEQKIEQITQLIKHFPVRQFILIGDSGERDPEVFEHIRKQFPAHIERIIIRDIDDSSTDNPFRIDGMGIIAGGANPETGCPKLQSLQP